MAAIDSGLIAFLSAAISIAITLPFHLQSDIDCEAKNTTTQYTTKNNKWVSICAKLNWIQIQIRMILRCRLPMSILFQWNMCAKRGEASDEKTSDLYSEIQHKKCDTKSNQSYYRFSKHKIAVVGRSKNTGSSVPSGRWLRARARRKVNTDRWSCQLLGRIYYSNKML